MRKQILALLSALGLAGSAAPASAQTPKDGTSNTIKAESTLKRAKAAHEIKAAGLGRQHKSNKASATNLNWKWSKNNAESTALKTSSAHKRTQASGKRIGNGLADRSWGSKQANSKNLTLNPQPLPPGIHTLNPQPLPPGVHTLNPQPLPPGVHTSPSTDVTLNPQPGIHTPGKTSPDQKPHGPQRPPQ